MCKSALVLQEDDDTPAGVRSVASGLVYPGVGPEIAMLHEQGRLSVSAITDVEALQTFVAFAKEEGIIPALESAHALAYAIGLAARRPAEESILVNLSGRGDRDVDYVRPITISKGQDQECSAGACANRA